MCVTAAIAGASLLASGASTVMSIKGANASKRNARIEDAMRQKELKERSQLAALEGMQAERVKREEYDINRSQQMSALAMMAGFSGENISFMQGTEPEQRQQMRDTVTAIRLGIASEQSSIKDQIRVSGLQRRQAVSNANRAKIGAVANFVGDAAQAASTFQKYRTPSKADAKN